VKLCKDCKYSKGEYIFGFPELVCLHPYYINLSTGNGHKSCFAIRHLSLFSWWPWSCGHKGRFWEPKGE
jgi:hypothetical protein